TNHVKHFSPDGRYVVTQRVFWKGVGKLLDYQVQLETRDRATDALVAATPRYDARLIDFLRFDPRGRVAGLVVRSIYRNPKMQVESEAEYTPIIWDAATGKELVKGKPFTGPVGHTSPNVPQLTVSAAGAVLVASFVPYDASVISHMQKGHWQLEDLGSGRP